MTTQSRVLPADRAAAAASVEAELIAHDAPLAPEAVHVRAPARDSATRRLLATADLVVLGLALSAVALVSQGEPTWADLAFAAAALPLWVLANKLLGLYDRDAHVIDGSTLNELPRIAYAATLATAGLWLATPLIEGLTLGRPELVMFWIVLLTLLPAARSSARMVVRATYPPERCIVVGSGLVASLIARKIAAQPRYGVKVVGYVDEHHQLPELALPYAAPQLRHLGVLAGLEDVCREQRIQRLVIAFSSSESHEPLLQVVRRAKALNLKITVVPRLFEAMGSTARIDQLEGMTVLGLSGFTRTRSSLRIKRVMDVVGSLLGLFVLAPLLLAIALAVKLTSSGPALFRQQRIGRDNHPFDLLKFRTMVDGADAMKAELEHLNEADGPMFKIAKDPRITRVGGFLRRTSLDELPQLVNVLRGEMSLVGPRPLVPSEDAQILGRHRTRLELTPGLTGPWQVFGRTNIPFGEMVELDYLYVADWSLWNDVKLLVRTAPVVVGARGL